MNSFDDKYQGYERAGRDEHYEPQQPYGRSNGYAPTSQENWNDSPSGQDRGNYFSEAPYADEEVFDPNHAQQEARLYRDENRGMNYAERNDYAANQAYGQDETYGRGRSYGREESYDREVSYDRGEAYDRGLSYDRGQAYGQNSGYSQEPSYEDGPHYWSQGQNDHQVPMSGEGYAHDYQEPAYDARRSYHDDTRFESDRDEQQAESYASVAYPNRDERARQVTDQGSAYVEAEQEQQVKATGERQAHQALGKASEVLSKAGSFAKKLTGNLAKKMSRPEEHDTSRPSNETWEETGQLAQSMLNGSVTLAKAWIQPKPCSYFNRESKQFGLGFAPILLVYLFIAPLYNVFDAMAYNRWVSQVAPTSTAVQSLGKAYGTGFLQVLLTLLLAYVFLLVSDFVQKGKFKNLSALLEPGKLMAFSLLPRLVLVVPFLIFALFSRVYTEGIQLFSWMIFFGSCFLVHEQREENEKQPLYLSLGLLLIWVLLQTVVNHIELI